MTPISPVTGERFQYPDVTVLKMDGAEVHGALVGPQLQPITDQQPMKFRALITVRTDFAPELKSSVDEIR